jgi:hypothetical protein
MEYSGLLKQYLINRGTYVDKKMEPLATKAELDNFNEMWMFPGLKVTVLEDEDGEMRDYRCKLVDGIKTWVPENNLTEESLNGIVQNLEETDEKLDDRLKQIEEMMVIQGNDLES